MTIVYQTVKITYLARPHIQDEKEIKHEELKKKKQKKVIWIFSKQREMLVMSLYACNMHIGITLLFNEKYLSPIYQLFIKK